MVHSKKGFCGTLQGNESEAGGGERLSVLGVYFLGLCCILPINLHHIFVYSTPPPKTAWAAHFVSPSQSTILVSLTAFLGQISATSSPFTGLLPLLIPATEQKAVFCGFFRSHAEVAVQAATYITADWPTASPKSLQSKQKKKVMTAFPLLEALMWPLLHLFKSFTRNMGSFQISSTTFVWNWLKRSKGVASNSRDDEENRWMRI